jgi:hypothetical protein
VFAPFQLFASATLLILIAAVVQAIVGAVTAGLGLGSGGRSWLAGPGGEVLLLAGAAITALWFVVAQGFYFMHAFAEGRPGAAHWSRATGALVLAVLIWGALVAVWVVGSQAVIDVLSLASKSAAKPQ